MSSPETIQAYSMLIDGELVDAVDGERFETVNSSSCEVWATMPRGKKADADRAVQAADEALGGPWSKLTASARGPMQL